MDAQLQKYLTIFGGICIEGPKACGKTWMGLNASKSVFFVEDSNEYHISNRSLAESDTQIALQGEAPHLIDEWQDIPEIWDAVRMNIDRDPKKGRFILTGSSTPKSKKPLHSGTGRIAHLEIRTMSLYETGDSSGMISLADIMDGKKIFAETGNITLDHLIDLVCAGGWPGTLDLPYEDRAKAVTAYLDSIISDAANMDGVRRNVRNLELLVRSLARNESTLASLSKVHEDTGIPLGGSSPFILNGGDTKPPFSYTTVQDYMDVLDRMHLIADQPAFDPNLKSSTRVGKTVKRHLTDPSLAVAALGIGREQLSKDLKSFGYYFEALCEHDLDIYCRSIGARLFHYRDGSGREIDAIIEMPDGTWGAFEIKLGANKIEEAAENLLAFRKFISGQNPNNIPKVLGVICGMSNLAYLRKDGVYVVPITALRP